MLKMQEQQKQAKIDALKCVAPKPPNKYQIVKMALKPIRTEIDEAQKAMCQEENTRLRLHKYICVYKLCHRLAKEIGETGKIIIVNNNIVRHNHRHPLYRHPMPATATKKKKTLFFFFFSNTTATLSNSTSSTPPKSAHFA